jgi:hypothetical protein
MPDDPTDPIAAFTPTDICKIRNAYLLTGKSLRRERYVVIRGNDSLQDEFWSFAAEQPAKALCDFLVTADKRAYVFDAETNRIIYTSR